jgi:AAA+ superfamily predicted ATPase
MHNDLFEVVKAFPDSDALERYGNLVGLDAIKERLEKEAEIMLRPDLLGKWSSDKHGAKLPALETLQRRPPLFVFAGDVGTGKTELSMTFGDKFARANDIKVELYCLSLRTRGSGAVGEMTRLISDAFRHLRTTVHRIPTNNKKPTSATILLIDEADSLAQSREMAQMHHEDRAGVNALIRGVDEIAAARLSCLIVMCTNRLNALDPAVRRRAAAVFQFTRPSQKLRVHLLESNLAGANLSKTDLEAIAEHLGTSKAREYGCTFSDITHRYIPSLILAAYPHEKITRNLALGVASDMLPTPPFTEEYEVNPKGAR